MGGRNAVPFRFTEDVVEPVAACPACDAAGSIQSKRPTKLVRLGAALLVSIVLVADQFDHRRIYLLALTLLFIPLVFVTQHGRCHACEAKVVRSVSGKWLRQ